MTNRARGLDRCSRFGTADGAPGTTSNFKSRGFKAYKQIVKLQYKLTRSEEMLQSYACAAATVLAPQSLLHCRLGFCNMQLLRRAGDAPVAHSPHATQRLVSDAHCSKRPKRVHLLPC